MERIEKVRCQLLLKDPWYGTFAAMMTWREVTHCDTMGVRVMSEGTVDTVYNREFVNSLTDEALASVIVHEIDHVVRLHCQRLSGRHPKIWNYAADMIVNGRKDSPNILVYNNKTSKRESHLPDNCIWYDLEENNLPTEVVYDYLKKNRVKWVTSGEGGMPVDDHSTWAEGTASEDDARAIVSGMTEQCSTACGNCPGHLTEAIKALKAVIVDWRRELSEWLGKECGGKRACMGRPNRRTELFGVPGSTSRAMASMSVFVDCSGSMGSEEIGEAFFQIERISHRASVRLIEFDHGIEHVSKYRRGAWKKLVIHGRGGTSIIRALEEAEARGLIGDVNIVITDGYLEWPPPKPYNVLWYIVSSSDCIPTWGKVMRPNKVLAARG